MSRLIDRLTELIHKWRHPARIQPDAGPAANQVAPSNVLPDTPRPGSLRLAYLNSLIASCRPLSISSLQFSGNSTASSIFLLDHLYVIPDTCTRIETSASESGEEKSRHLSAIEALAGASSQRVVLLGSPGSGKSIFSFFLALQHARALNSTEMDIHELLPDWPGPALMPVLVRLSSLAESLDPQSLDGDEVIENYLHNMDGIGVYAPYLLEEADRSGGLFIFDGLDEIADPASAIQIGNAIQAFVTHHSNHPATRALVTCRTLTYDDPVWQLADWERHELAPFSELKTRQFIENWYTEIIRLDPSRRAYHEVMCAKLLTSLHPGNSNQLLDFTANPLLLTLLAVTHTDKNGLPEPRVSIYQACLDHLFSNWSIEAGPTARKLQLHRLSNALQVPQEVVNHALQEIAYQAHTWQPKIPDGVKAYPNSLISEERLSTILLTHLGSMEKVQTALNYFRQLNGILTVHKVSLPETIPPLPTPIFTYAFIHPAIQDYLAALYLARKVDLGFETRYHVNQFGRWRNVLLMLGEHVCYQEADYQRMDGILNTLAPAPLPQEGLSLEGWRAIWMASELLYTYRHAFPQREQEHKHIPRGLVNLLQAKGASLPPRERAEAGDVLDLLGDPRFRPDAWHLPDESLLGFLLISAGPFYLGSDPLKDPACRETEQPQHVADLPDYYLARHPVTVAQFKAFVNDAGFHPANPTSLNGRLSRPVVYVTWYDALHYCEWLTEKLKVIAARRINEWALNETERVFWRRLEQGEMVVTLPSEAEWEKAARGPSASPSKNRTEKPNSAIYPWGDEFDPNMANTAETGLGKTSLVGCFPLGASPYGILDMSGNVWEWTRSIWGADFIQGSYPYPYNPSDGRENLDTVDTVLRVIRGGSFFYHSWHTRTSSRGRSAPLEWDWDIGFRIAVSALKSHSRGV